MSHATTADTNTDTNWGFSATGERLSIDAGRPPVQSSPPSTSPWAASFATNSKPVEPFEPVENEWIADFATAFGSPSATLNKSQSSHPPSNQLTQIQLQQESKSNLDGNSTDTQSRSSFAAEYPTPETNAQPRKPVITKSHQLNHIQSIFNDSQKIAYVGLCYLEIHSRKQTRLASASKTASQSYNDWAERFMSMLYAFLDVKEAEQTMITNLALHGLVPHDLSKSLIDDAEKALERLQKLQQEQAWIEEQEAKWMAESGSSQLPRPPQTQSTSTTADITDIRVTILSHLFILCICDGFYDARSRSLLRAVAHHLNIEWWDLAKLEDTISEQLRIQDSESHKNEQVKLEQSIIKERNEKDSQGRWLYMGLATLAGGAVIGVTAGLAAPLIASGIISAMSTFQIAGGVGAGAAAFMSGTTGIAIIASSGSAIGGGLTGYKMHKRTQGISEFEFVRLEEALVSILANKEKRKKARGSVKKEKEKEKEKKERVEVMWSSDGVEGTSGNDDRLVVLGDDVGQKGQAVVGKRVDMLQAVEHRRGSSSVSSVSSPMDRTSRESRDIGRELNAPILMATATPVTEEGASLKTSTGDGSAPSPKPNVLITIAGWVGSLESRDDFTLPFSTLTPGVHGEQYALVWETQALIELGCAVRLLVSEVTGFLVQQGIQYFLLPVLMAGLMGPLWALKLTYMVDNPWGNGLTKAKKAGRILADTLINRVQGNRPVTLVGFSLGARVIYYCLLELASRGEAAFSIVEEAYLFGTPVMATNKEWRAISSVVSGRLVNGYLTNDYILSILYRASSAFLADVAGLFPVQNVEGIENYCLDTVLKGGGHLEYRSAMPRILKHVGFSVDDEFFDDGEKEAEQERLDMEAEKERVKNDNERAKEEAAKKKQAEYEERLKKKREEEEARKAEAAAAPKRSWFGGWGSSSSSTGSLDNVAKVAKGDEAVFEVKEIKSTLPPLVLTLDGSATFPQESSPYNDDGSLI